MIILGLDPSLCWYGWGLVRLSLDPTGLCKALVLGAGCIRTAPDARKRHLYQADQDAERLIALARGVASAMRGETRAGSYAPIAHVVCEAPAGSQHARSAAALGQAFGVTLGVATSLGRGLRFVQAHEVKLAVGGSKGASKAAVAAGVERLTGWRSTAKTQPAREAEADAVAVALTMSVT